MREHTGENINIRRPRCISHGKERDYQRWQQINWHTLNKLTISCIKRRTAHVPQPAASPLCWARWHCCIAAGCNRLGTSFHRRTQGVSSSTRKGLAVARARTCSSTRKGLAARARTCSRAYSIRLKSDAGCLQTGQIKSLGSSSPS